MTLYKLLSLLFVGALSIYIAVDVSPSSILGSLVVLAIGLICLVYAWREFLWPILSGMLQERRDERDTSDVSVRPFSLR
jgi:hypothetical protein